MEEQIATWIAAYEAAFGAFTKRLESQLRKAEAALLRTVLTDHVGALAQKDGAFASSVRNISKANMVSRSLDTIRDGEMKAVMKSYAEELLEIPGRNAQYYFATGQDRAKVERIEKDLAHIRALIGMREDGALLEGGYLYRLAQTDELREKLRAFLVASVATRQSVTDAQNALRRIIVGNKDADGALVSYFRRYAYDAHSTVREVNNLHFADELGMNWFVYQGGIIKTTRRFCEKKNGKVFSRQEALRDWAKDPDLIDKKTVSQYRPLLDRGRYNCRHFLMWISDTAAEQRRLKQAQ